MHLREGDIQGTKNQIILLVGRHEGLMKQTIWECEVCQRNKSETVTPPDLLQPLSLPDTVWEEISMDFVNEFPTSKGRSVIMVVLDRFSKFAHFVAMQHPYTAPKVAQIFIEEIFSLYGLPKAIVSDRNAIFLSAFWSELFKL